MLGPDSQIDTEASETELRLISGYDYTRFRPRKAGKLLACSMLYFGPGSVAVSQPMRKQGLGISRGQRGFPKAIWIQSPSFGWEESLAVQTQAKLCQLVSVPEAFHLLEWT